MHFASIVQLYALIIVHLQLGMNDTKVNVITAQRTKINKSQDIPTLHKVKSCSEYVNDCNHKDTYRRLLTRGKKHKKTSFRCILLTNEMTLALIVRHPPAHL